MSVENYLRQLANHAIVRDAKKEQIRRSIETLASRLTQHFDLSALSSSRIDRQSTFGSYTRGTSLPRDMDRNSDVDYMIVFQDNSAKPQTYIDRLKRFALASYSSSEIKQSNPTVVLSLNHISFDLVPAINTFFTGLQIPAKASDYEDWQSTSPDNINAKLSEKNKDYKNLIKPLARLVKYWNAENNYPFDSFDLENRIIDCSFLSMTLFSWNPITLWNLFYEFMKDLDVGMFYPQWKKDRIERLHRLLNQTRDALNSDLQWEAENLLSKLLPPLD